MNKETNSKFIAAHKKINELNEKLNKAINEYNKLVDDNYCKDIKGKFIRIIYRDADFDDIDYIKEYINVEDVYIDTNDKITYFGKGFKYEDGKYYKDMFASYNEMYQQIITCSELDNGNVKVVEVSKEEFEKELSNMLDFIRENGKKYRKIRKDAMI